MAYVRQKAALAVTDRVGLLLGFAQVPSQLLHRLALLFEAAVAHHQCERSPYQHDQLRQCEPHDALGLHQQYHQRDRHTGAHASYPKQITVVCWLRGHGGTSTPR